MMMLLLLLLLLMMMMMTAMPPARSAPHIHRKQYANLHTRTSV